MTRLERKKRTLGDKILSVTDYREQAKLADELQSVQVALSAAEEHWLALHD